MSDEKLKNAVEAGTWRESVAANITGLAANTWDSSLRRDERLLVPIDVRALVAPVGGAALGRVPTVTEPAAGAPEPWPLPPAPFQGTTPRKRGIFLHFAMPDALTRGSRQPAGAAVSDNAIGLRPLPDRFVIVRLLHGGTTRRAWVLEADRAVRTPLENWREGMAHPAPGAGDPLVIPPDQLTAVAGGDVAWAATVDAVIDRFAMYDDLQDVPAAARPNAVLTYLVAGWWSRPDLDPLAGVTSIGNYTARLKSLGWVAPALRSRSTKRRIAEEESRSSAGKLSSRFVKPGSIGKVGQTEVTSGKTLDIEGVAQPASLPLVPSQTLVHGVAYGVRADGNGPDLRPAAAALEVAFGPHPSAALAALLAGAAAPADRASAERLITAFQMNLLATLNTPDGLAAVDEERHARAFVAISGGARAERDRVSDGDPVGWPTPSPAPPPSPNVKGAKDTDDPTRATSANVKLDFTNSRTQARNDSISWRVDEARSPGVFRQPPSFRDVSVPLPRFHYPADLAFLVRGAARSARHGGDGRFDAQGRLACRVPAGIIRGYSGVLDGDDLALDLRTLGSGAIPLEVDLLLREAMLTDPYRIAELAAVANAKRQLPAAAVTRRFQAEAALRCYGATGDATLIAAEAADTLRRSSIAEGEDPSPVALHLWSQPWVPLWCEWEMMLHVDEGREGWTLDVVDLQAGEIDPAPAAGEIVRGRTLLTSSPAKALASDIGKWLVEEDQRDAAGQSQLSDDQEAVLQEAARAAAVADLLGGTFEGVRETLLGLDPARARLERIEGPGLPPLRPTPIALPRLLVGGAASVTRLRIVDAFGRFLDVPKAALDAGKIPIPQQRPNGAAGLSLPPRLQCPARVLLRLVDAAAPDGVRATESRVNQERPDLAHSPLAGFLLPDHVDEALEFFDANGTPIGQLMHDPLTGSVLWEGAPGTPGPLGAPPAGGHPAVKHLARLATGLVTADARARAAGGGFAGESALSALLRVIDTTLWTSDPFGATGTRSIASLVGRPIAIVRATLSLDLRSDLDTLDYAAAPADRDSRRRAFEEIAARAIRVRLGEVTRSDDGLLAYAIDDVYDRLHVISPDVRLMARESGPGEGHFRAFGQASNGAPPPRTVVHPYLDGETAIDLHPRQLLRLTLLMVPGLSVTATCGVLPRKRIALARDWFEKVLERLSPSIRVGPVLFDATAEGVRMPKIAALGPRQRFTHKPDPLGWRADVILAATQTAYLPDQPAGVREGWIRVSPIPPEEESGT